MATDRQGFDEWHANILGSPRRAEIGRAELGLPPAFDSNSLLPWEGITELTSRLGLASGDLLVDLACGRGAYGLEVARRSGARLIGIDFSAVALTAAEENARRFGPADRVEFRVGDLTATGLPDSTADAIMCVDSMQFADPVIAGLRECRRILVPGGRLVMTCWEAIDTADENVPERIRRVRTAHDLAEAGFTRVEVIEKPDWRAAERAYWEAADRTDADGDPALVSMRNEATRVLASFNAVRRVLATALAP